MANFEPAYILKPRNIYFMTQCLSLNFKTLLDTLHRYLDFWSNSLHLAKEKNKQKY